ncbi:MAG: FAD:protein FMN transferase [Myxococcota bacterium]
MTGRGFRAMGTAWWVWCDRADLLDGVPAGVAALEARLSRFRDGSALRRLQRDGAVEDAVLAEVVRLALRMRDWSGGAFDPAVGSALVALGYDRDHRSLADAPAAPARPAPLALQVDVDGDVVTVRGPGALDLGGIAKGWAVDQVHDALRQQGAREILVDGGGDLRASGRRFAIGVGDDHALPLSDGAIATSSVSVRTWTDAAGRRLHHVIDPATALPAASSVVTATVRAPDAATADALATAILVRPDLLPRLGELSAAAWVVDRAGICWETPSWGEAA